MSAGSAARRALNVGRSFAPAGSDGAEPTTPTLVNLTDPGTVVTDAETSVTVPFPAGTEAGHFLLLAIGFTNPDTPAYTITPDGYEQYAQLNNSALRTAVYGKVLTAADLTGSAITIAANVPSARSWTVVPRAYAGVDPAAPVDGAAVVTASTTNVASLDSGVITTVGGNELLVGIWEQITTANTAFTDWTPPAGWGNVINDCANAPSLNNPAVGTWELPVSAAGEYGPYTASSPQTRRTVSVLLALRPAA